MSRRLVSGVDDVPVAFERLNTADGTSWRQLRGEFRVMQCLSVGMVQMKLFVNRQQVATAKWMVQPEHASAWGSDVQRSRCAVIFTLPQRLQKNPHRYDIKITVSVPHSIKIGLLKWVPILTNNPHPVTQPTDENQTAVQPMVHIF